MDWLRQCSLCGLTLYHCLHWVTTAGESSRVYSQIRAGWHRYRQKMRLLRQSIYQGMSSILAQKLLPTIALALLLTESVLCKHACPAQHSAESSKDDRMKEDGRDDDSRGWPLSRASGKGQGLALPLPLSTKAHMCP